MGAEGPGRSVDLAQIFLAIDLRQLTVESVDIDCQFLPQGGWGGRLPMRQAQQGSGGELLGSRVQFVEQLLDAGAPDLLHRLLEAQGV